LLDVLVIADNCTDKTAEIAKNSGASVFERNDLTLRGKGYALQWFFSSQLKEPERFDSFVFLDADCFLSSNFLDVLDEKFQSRSPGLLHSKQCLGKPSLGVKIPGYDFETLRPAAW